MGEDSGMDSMAGSVASDIFDLADPHDLSDVEDSVSEPMSDCAASEASQEAMCVALAESRESILESECVRELLA